ncbi:unnamed protein product (macronuclear) [Paramecium tetraurelia]|uniref:Cilium assembly protein DZIP1 N-terminal domain-containing protein n=1 Tax=Paramecium tetraurelia TaxID=5888 RepID=A0BKF3_PARTE|nr:uncharacterized protein GSPATT00029651001 [Paramecium tetraurelia]CAK59020.1 unnamed protein product [Paramecium tetraurelia]|eukprot:XP_001426418.1 hypothetical protein (macronuclear) [Paramecium tetraurelia strain d4-2]
MDNYKKYLFDEKFQEPQPRNTYSFQAQESQEEQPVESNFDDEYKKDFLQNQIKNIREKLIMMGFPSLGDLYSNSNSEVDLTVKVLVAVIKQRREDMDFKNTYHERVNKIEAEKQQLVSNFERVSNNRKILEQENTTLQAKIKSTEKVQKEQINKLMLEREDLQKQLSKLQSRSTQFEHELKQRDLEIQKLKDHIKKQQASKTYKNSLEMTQPIEQGGPSVFAANGEYEFSQLVMKKWEEVNNKLLRENEQLRENLVKIHTELGEILQIRRDVYIKRRKIDFGDENIPPELDNPQQNMHQFKSDLFKAPLETNGKQAISMLQENLSTFKELMKKFDQQYELQMNEDEIEIEAEGGKTKACKNLTELFKNYNYIFEAQDKMISQIINKSQNLKKIDELNFNLNRFNRVLDDKQIDDVKKYLQDQKKYLDESKNEMDMIKKQFQHQLKKREEEKQIIQMKRQMLEETNDKFKENIRMLENASKQALQQLNQDNN